MIELKSIWHTTDEAPESYADIAFYVDGYLYFASYQPQYNQYGIFGVDKVERWCYVKELSLYILAFETEFTATKKKLDICVKALNKIANTDIKVIERKPLYYARAMFSVTNNALGRIQDIEQINQKEQ